VEGIKKINNVGKLRISTVVLRHMQDHLEEMINFAIDCKADELIVNWPRTVGFLLDNKNNVPTMKQEEFKKIFAELKEKYKNKIFLSTHIPQTELLEGECCGGNNIIFIGSDYKISPCSWMCKIAPQYTSKSTLETSSFSHCIAELEDFSKLLKQRKSANKKDCPFIDFKKTGSLL
jgi:MoaA/NifB/PqqE/SkfB family radical SAM enzyme